MKLKPLTEEEEVRLDHLITAVKPEQLRGALRHALGLRTTWPGNKELGDLLQRAVYRTDEKRLLGMSNKSVAALDRKVI